MVILFQQNVSGPGQCGTVCWSAVAYNKTSGLQSLVPAHACVVGSIPVLVAYGRQPIDVSLFTSVSLKSIKIFLKNVSNDRRFRYNGELLWEKRLLDYGAFKNHKGGFLLISTWNLVLENPIFWWLIVLELSGPRQHCLLPEMTVTAFTGILAL